MTPIHSLSSTPPTVRVLIPLLLLAMLLGGCAADSVAEASPPGGGDARALLDQVVQAAMADEDVCAFAAARANCETQIQDPAAVPDAAPAVTCSVDVVFTDDRVDGHLLVVQTPGDDGPVESDFFVIQTDDGLRSMTTPYWTGIRMADITAEQRAGC